MITHSIKSKYNEFWASWVIINFYSPINSRKSTLRETKNYKDKQPIRISDISIIRGFN